MPLKLIYSAAGKLEGGGDRSGNNLLKVLDERGIKSEFHVMKSGHDWTTGRGCLHELAQRLLQ